MARGWESKSVESQQADVRDKSDKAKLKLSPEAATRLRERGTLSLSRKRVLQQLGSAQNPRHRQLLQDELADLDRKLSRLTE
jgi:hypothetical protein